MKATKIDWCDCTINPVVGCKRGCKYCYADRMNTRMHFVPNFKCPQFFPHKLEQFRCKKPKSIFMNSMSDVEFWEQDWIDAVEKATEKNPQHKYIFLTKGNWAELEARDNYYMGLTVTKQADLIGKANWFHWLSIEPMHEEINIDFDHLYFVGQVIIGAETGNRVGKIIPQKQWIDALVQNCDGYGVRVFMKESLREIMGKDFRQDELMWEAAK